MAVRPGKGEVLWRSLAVTSGDVVVFLDSDLVEFGAGFVPALLESLLTADGVCLVKGFYRRPLRVRAGESDTGGGWVTELLESVPFAPGYGVEIGLLMDTEAGWGLDALAQVNLGVRKHRNRTLLELGVMSRQIVSAMFTCARCPDGGGAITQFHQVGGAGCRSAMRSRSGIGRRRVSFLPGPPTGRRPGRDAVCTAMSGRLSSPPARLRSSEGLCLATSQVGRANPADSAAGPVNRW